jgi:tetratricopeptide (TPR) repeat protein
MRQHEEAERVLESALQTFNELGSSRMIAIVVSQKARNLHFQRRHEEGLELYNQALAFARTSGDTGLIDSIESNVAEVEFRQGNVERALEIARSLLSGQPAWERISRALLQANIAAYLIELRRFDEARDFARAAIKDARPAGPVTFAESVQHFGAIAAGRQDWQQSARLLGYCKRAYADLGTHLDFTEQQEYDKLMVVLAENLKPDALKALLAEGATWDDDRVYNEALKV